MEEKCLPLIEILTEIPDFRKEKGKRHPLSAILALACVAVLCGCRGYRAIAEWGRNYDSRFIQALGFTHWKTPCASTLHNIFGNNSFGKLNSPAIMNSPLAPVFRSMIKYARKPTLLAVYE